MNTPKEKADEDEEVVMKKVAQHLFSLLYAQEKVIKQIVVDNLCNLKIYVISHISSLLIINETTYMRTCE